MDYPSVEYPDIVNYLVRTPDLVDNRAVNEAYKSGVGLGTEPDGEWICPSCAP